MSDSGNEFALDEETGEFQFLGFSENHEIESKFKNISITEENTTSKNAKSDTDQFSDSDTDAFSDSDDGINDVLEENIEITPWGTPAITRKRKSDPSTWAKTINQKKRMRGEDYFGKKKVNNNDWVYNIPKLSKMLKTKCSCPDTKKTVQCRSFTDKEREQIFETFWKGLKTWDEKRVHIRTLVLRTKPVDLRSRHAENESRRRVTLKYHLKTDSKILPVCKTMFLNSLSINQKVVYNALTACQPTESSAVPPKRKYPSINSILGQKRASAETFLWKLNKMESHYCRSSSSKLYLEPIWESLQDLYSGYQNYCKEEKVPILCSSSFFQTFYDMNLSLFSPKKDQCDICCGFQHGNIESNIYEQHIINKNDANAEKESDTKTKKHVFTVDVERVLLSPTIQASMAYYKMKLATHNYTLFDNVNKDGFCNVWPESEGGVTGNDFASLLSKFINDKKIAPGEEIIFFSDGCTAQNRNMFMANALLNMAIQKKITIIQKYLEKGHTHMECDSMHSKIERHIKKKQIYDPKGYVLAALKARRKPRPYHVQYMDHTYFKDFSAVSFLTSIRPGNKKGDPKVTDIRCLKYKPTGEIQYKLYYTDEWQPLPQRIDLQVESKPLNDLPGLYNSPCHITTKKFNDLQDLKTVIPKKYHAFYDNLLHQ